MKIIVLIFAVLFPCIIAAYAAGPEYDSSCSWVLERCATNDIPARDRIFVATTPGSGEPSLVTIIRYGKGLNVRDMIDMTRFRGTSAAVIVLRAKKPTTPVFHKLVKPNKRPSFIVKPLDMIWISAPLLPST